MGYCIMSIIKVKSMATLKAKYLHNYRLRDVQNADKTLSANNEELLVLKNDDGEPVNYVEKFHERTKNCPKFRKDAVRAIEVITTFSRESDVDLDAWKVANVDWLKESFDHAGDGKPNVISVVYHADEPGNVHCHSLVIPIDEKGKLNASAYINGRIALIHLQNSYAKKMKPLNLERGLEGSSAKHNNIRKFYANLNKTMNNICPVIENETAEQYRSRALEELNTAYVAAMGDIDRKRRTMQQKFEKEHQLERAAWKNEFSESRAILQAELSELQNDIHDCNEQKSKLQDDIEFLKAMPQHQIQEKIIYANTVLQKEKLLFEKDPDFYHSINIRLQQLESIPQHDEKSWM